MKTNHLNSWDRIRVHTSNTTQGTSLSRHQRVLRKRPPPAQASSHAPARGAAATLKKQDALPRARAMGLCWWPRQCMAWPFITLHLHPREWCVQTQQVSSHAWRSFISQFWCGFWRLNYQLSQSWHLAINKHKHASQRLCQQSRDWALKARASSNVLLTARSYTQETQTTVELRTIRT